jgi:hypothetical protein
MTGMISNNIGSNAEVSRGVQRLYADLQKNIQDNNGKVESGFSESFTSADGLIKITLSTEGLAAFAGDKNADGTTVAAGDVGVRLTSSVKSGYSGENDVTATGSSLSDSIHDVKQITAHEANALANVAITTFSVDPNKDESLPQPNADGGAAGTTSALAGANSKGNNPLQNAALQAKQDATNHLIDTLTTFLQGLKSDKSTLLQSSDQSNSTKDSNDGVPYKAASSLFIRIDVQA